MHFDYPLLPLLLFEACLALDVHGLLGGNPRGCFGGLREASVMMFLAVSRSISCILLIQSFCFVLAEGPLSEVTTSASEPPLY